MTFLLVCRETGLGNYSYNLRVIIVHIYSCLGRTKESILVQDPPFRNIVVSRLGVGSSLSNPQLFEGPPPLGYLQQVSASLHLLSISGGRFSHP